MARLYVEYCCRASDKDHTHRGAGTASEGICYFCQSGSNGEVNRGMTLETYVDFMSLEDTIGISGEAVL